MAKDNGQALRIAQESGRLEFFDRPRQHPHVLGVLALATEDSGGNSSKRNLHMDTPATRQLREQTVPQQIHAKPLQTPAPTQRAAALKPNPNTHPRPPHLAQARLRWNPIQTPASAGQKCTTETSQP